MPIIRRLLNIVLSFLSCKRKRERENKESSRKRLNNFLLRHIRFIKICFSLLSDAKESLL